MCRVAFFCFLRKPIIRLSRDKTSTSSTSVRATRAHLPFQILYLHQQSLILLLQAIQCLGSDRPVLGRRTTSELDTSPDLGVVFARANAGHQLANFFVELDVLFFQLGNVIAEVLDG